MTQKEANATFSLDAQAVLSLREMFGQSQRIVILPHTAPDGDALGATIGLQKILLSLLPQSSCVVISPDPIDQYFRWMPGTEQVAVWGEDEAQCAELIARADLVVQVDHNQTSRLRHPSLVAAVRASAVRRILIDHHLNPEEGFELAFSFPGLSSSCELVYMLIKAAGWAEHITPEVATCLLSGLVTDTGRLMYGCFYPEVFAHFAELLALGADYALIIDRLSYHSSEERLRFHGYALQKMELYEELHTAVICISQQEMKALGITRADTEGVVNLPLEIEGVQSACFIREDADQVKLSMRSIGDLAVNVVAERGFGGGGHRNAAGAECKAGGIAVAKNIYLRELKNLLVERNQ